MEVTQVRFSRDITFNTVNGRELMRQASAKNSLRLSGMAYELGRFKVTVTFSVSLMSEALIFIVLGGR